MDRGVREGDGRGKHGEDSRRGKKREEGRVRGIGKGNRNLPREGKKRTKKGKRGRSGRVS